MLLAGEMTARDFRARLGRDYDLTRNGRLYMKGILLLLVVCAPLACGQPAFAQLAGDVADSKKATAPPTDDVRLLLELLSRPDIQSWLKAQAEHSSAPVQDTGASNAAPTVQEIAVGTLNATRSSLRELAGAAPTLTSELNKAQQSL